MNDQDVERELMLDRRIYGSCYWKVVDGKKVRVPPEAVFWDTNGRPRDIPENGAAPLTVETSANDTEAKQ